MVKPYMRSSIFPWLPFLIRPLIAIYTTTFFQPDEYFQSLEPAHRYVFGFGVLTWEWTSDSPIRSFTYPLIFVPVYQIIQYFRLEETGALIWLPKLVQSIFAALTDYYTYRLSKRLLGENAAFISLFLSLLSFFNVLALSRTLSNSMETSLTIMAIYFWDFDSGRDGDQGGFPGYVAAFVAAISFLIRPTSALIWAALAIYQCAMLPAHIPRLATRALLASCLAFPASLLVDKLFYRSFQLTVVNFIKVNFSSVALFYGKNPWHYYLTQGLPILCTTALPFSIHGMWITLHPAGSAPLALKCLAFVVIFNVAVYSLAGHKEWRFLHPLLPIFHVFAARSLEASYHWRRTRSEARAKLPLFNLRIKTSHLWVILFNLPVSFYVMRYHGRGQIAAMYYLRSLPRTELVSLGVLMPCHSVPWQSYLHRVELENGRAWSLSCEPPLLGQNLLTYRDETKHFYEDPAAHVEQYFSKAEVRTNHTGVDASWHHIWPSHLMLFKSLLTYRPAHIDSKDEYTTIEDILWAHGYRQVWESGWNGWEGDEMRRGAVGVWKSGNELGRI
ncbi:Alg9-like mannosyltransferase family-domain-containing protein [Cantharellus anzutake]|uniref:Alg9-like mannosyltransferase family-domain-containing protein n=1 Tax=Cantharellus anzutake TaxID=1750568 RepID=UPI0019056DF1|nr:Alg9-like mannosyltransferase family-domain-containing protein [Cantharellus anzutake]KAF8333943.1 Alg9-like mannosyltransferase family-domain-containing protein [Cantharellus anzutake]